MGLCPTPYFMSAEQAALRFVRPPKAEDKNGPFQPFLMQYSHESMRREKEFADHTQNPSTQTTHKTPETLGFQGVLHCSVHIVYPLKNFSDGVLSSAPQILSTVCAFAQRKPPPFGMHVDWATRTNHSRSCSCLNGFIRGQTPQKRSSSRKISTRSAGKPPRNPSASAGSTTASVA